MRFLCRMCGSLILAIAVVFAVLDATRSVSAERVVLTPLAVSWNAIWPEGLAGLQRWMTEHAGDWVWHVVAVALVGLPAFALLGLLACLFLVLGRRPVDGPAFGRAAWRDG